MIKYILGFIFINELLKTPDTVGAIKAKSKFMPVYKTEPFLNFKGQTNTAWARDKAGVYIIKERGKIVYIGSSKNVGHKAMRHFEPWQPTHPSGKQHYYKNDLSDYTMRIILTNTPQQAARLESALIHKHKPRDNYVMNDLFFERDEKRIKAILEEYKEFEVEAPF